MAKQNAKEIDAVTIKAQNSSWDQSSAETKG